MMYIANKKNIIAICNSVAIKPILSLSIIQLFVICITIMFSSNSAMAAEIETWHYGLDAAGNITSKGLDPVPENATHIFNYDELHRLINEINPDNTDSYSYDANGNRTALTRDGNTTGYLIFSNNNKIDQVGGEPRSYDEVGNTTSDRNGTRTFSYDQAGRLSEVHENSQLIASYTYNAHGQRVSKSTPSGASYYLYDISGKLISEYDENGQTIKEYVHLNGVPVAQLEESKITYLHTDHLATPRKGTNQAGDLVWQWDSEAFGDALDHGVDGTTVNLRFPGQYYDEETGLYYNYYRYYDPSTGRYITSDPIGLRGGLNTYTYVNSNSLNSADPTGLICGTGACAATAWGIGVGVGIVSTWWSAQNTSDKWDWVDDPRATNEHDDYKDRYAEPPPPNLDKCELLKWKLRREKELLRARQAFDRKWGVFGALSWKWGYRHASANAQSRKAIKNLKDKIKRECNKKCEKP